MAEPVRHDHIGHDEGGVLRRVEYITVAGREVPYTRRVTSWFGVNSVAEAWDEDGPVALIFDNSLFPSPLMGTWWGCGVCEKFHPERLATCPMVGQCQPS